MPKAKTTVQMVTGIYQTISPYHANKPAMGEAASTPVDWADNEMTGKRIKAKTIVFFMA